ncbi:GOLPH3/VPS74 family protein [Demequina sp.]|uniref:GOLPH3/VPS74 family protein n=1 Tax=Demequina sp. TaxID=2050685 RepID=UPI003A89F1F7
MSAAPTVVEDLLLVLFDPRNGSIHGEGTLYYPLAGAVLSELAVDGAVELSEARSAYNATVTAVGVPPEDALLRDMWERVDAKPQKVYALLTAVGPRLRTPVLDRLVERGDIVRTRGTRWKVFPSTKLSDGGTGRRDALIEQLHAVLVNGIEPPPRTAMLAALLSASGQLHALHRDIPWSGEVRARGKALEKGDWGAAGVSQAVSAAASAVAIMVAATAAGASAGS